MKIEESELYCPECQSLFDPMVIGEIGQMSIVEGVQVNKHLAVRLNCPKGHHWDLPGKTLLDVVGARPELAPGYIHTKLADESLSRIMRKA